MKKYVISSTLVDRDDFFERLGGLEIKFEEIGALDKPVVEMEFNGSQKELYEFLGYTHRDVLISSSKTVPGYSPPWERKLKNR